MAFDASTNQLVLFGGEGWTVPSLNDTWTWDGTSWTLTTPAASPLGRNDAGMGYDAATGQLVLFGGYNNTALGDTWTWDGTTWTQASPSTSPPPSSPRR
jgi:hypothetical protein